MKTLTKNSTRFIALILAIAIGLGIFAVMPSTASAETLTMAQYTVDVPRASDGKDTTPWGHDNLQLLGGWQTGYRADSTSVYCQDSYEGRALYCIEPGVQVYNGDVYSGFNETFWNNYPSELNPTISPTIIKAYLGRIMQYAWQGYGNLNWDMDNPEHQRQIAHYTASQLLVWETVVGERDANFNKIDATKNGKSNVKDVIKSNHPLRSMIFEYYNDMETKVKQHTMLPSFLSRSTGSAKTYELEWTGNDYSVTLTDTNNVIGNYNFSTNTSGVNISTSGNKLTIRSSSAPKGKVSITAEKKNGQRSGIVTWSDGRTAGGNIENGTQDFITYGENVSDPVSGYVYLETKTGNLHLVKTSEDGKVEGISFTITGDGGYNVTKKTDSKGVIDIADLNPGVYTVTEQSIDRYQPQESKKVTIVSGQTATVTFNNTLKRGDLQVTKDSEDGMNEGVKFHLFGTSLSGNKVDEYAVTNSDGIATFEDVLISGSSPYTIEEVNTNARYVVPKDQTVPIQWAKVSKVKFTNVLKKFRVTVHKTDAETEKAQGDASLAGAVYGIYQGDKLVDSYTTDANGSFTTDYYVCGYNWTVKEISPSEGYLLNESTYAVVGSKPEMYTLEYNSSSLNVKESVEKGKISIVKHTDNGETGIETPEAGAVFNVYLRSAGSYEKAKNTEKDVLTCDENGFAETKLLPYGVYIVHQVSGWEGRDKIKDFEVFISDDNKTYRYILNNSDFKSHLKITKYDAQTGKTIPYAGAGFQIFKPDGTKITQTYTYPEVTTIDTFYTSNSGEIVTPEALEYGNGYYIVEVAAPYGYVLDDEPVYFDINEETAVEEDGITVVKVKKADKVQKGIIKVKKTGEIFSEVSVTDDIYQPVYANTGLQGAVYDIVAGEDIYTPDGTLRYKADSVVDSIETNSDGFASSKELFLGRYNIVEVKSPYGTVINDQPIEVDITYAGQEIAVTDVTSECYNERQKVSVSMTKLFETDELFGIGTNGEINSVVFGLFAEEDIRAADGSVIPKDGMIERISISDDDTISVSTDLPFGKYYLRELETDDHYVLISDVYPFEFKYGDQDEPVIEIKPNDGTPVENKIKRGDIKGIKVDETDVPLGGATIGLFKNDCEEFNEENALLTVVTSDDGSFEFSDIPYGEWIVREIAQPEGFVLCDALFHIAVLNDSEIVEIKITNNFIRGNLSLTKYDADFPENKLTGAEFEVYRDTNENKELDGDDELIGLMEETFKGVYEMTDIQFGGVFVKEKTAPEGFVIDENAYYIFIDTDGKTYDVENEAGVGFMNQSKKGSLKIVKTSSDGRKDGFEFRVTGPYGYEQTFKTPDTGEILIEDLRIGEYVVTEIKNDVSESYIISDPITVEVIADETIVVNVHNDKITVDTPPNTGYNINLWLWIILAVSGAVLAVITFFSGRKKGQQK